MLAQPSEREPIAIVLGSHGGAKCHLQFFLRPHQCIFKLHLAHVHGASFPPSQLLEGLRNGALDVCCTYFFD